MQLHPSDLSGRPTPPTTNPMVPKQPNYQFPAAQHHFNRSALSPSSLSFPNMNPIHHSQGQLHHHASPRLPGSATVSVSPAVRLVDAEGDLLPHKTATNLAWLWILILFLAGAASIAIYALANGQPSRLYKGVNFQGLACGGSYPLKDLPYLYFPLDPTSGNLLLKDARCVVKCPNEEDVSKKAVVATTKRVVRRHVDLGSSMVFEFDISSPAYASTLVANAYCLPVDTRLRNQVLPVLDVFWRQLSFAIGSLFSSWLLIGKYGALTFLISVVISLTLMRQLPTSTVYVSSFCFPLALIFGGFTLISYGINGGSENFSSVIFSANYTWALTFGFFMLTLGIVTSVYQLKSPIGRSRACKVLDMTGGVVADMPNLLTAPIISSAVTLVFVMLWIVVFVHICSLGYIEAHPSTIPKNTENGSSLVIAPLHRHLLFPSFGLFAAFYWIVLLLWVLEMIKAIQAFVVSYAGTVWHFAYPEGSDSKDVGWCPVLIALSVAFGNHFGSFAFAGVMLGITAPIRTFAQWASARNDMCSDTSASFLTSLFGVFGQYLRSVVDFFGVGGFTEMAISSSNFWISMEVASRRLGLQYSPSARLNGALGGVCNCLAGVIAIPISLFVFTSLSEGGGTSLYDSPNSNHFISSPMLTALMCFILSWVIASHFTSMWATLADSVVYSFLVESSAVSGEIDENPTDKIHPHTQMRDLVLETMDELSSDY